jgi:DNA-binding MarR family transcriptional regulator
VKSLHNRTQSAAFRARGVAVGRLFEIALLLGDALGQGLAEGGLTVARAELLWRLRGRGSITQRQLSQELRCTPRNVTGLVDGLEASGLVDRRPHPTDRRATLVTLTGAGSAVVASMDQGYQQTAAELFGDFDDAELDAFSEGLGRVLERLRDDARPERVAR